MYPVLYYTVLYQLEFFYEHSSNLRIVFILAARV